MTGEKKSRQRVASPRECRLQGKAIHSRHSQIHHQTTVGVLIPLRKKIGGRDKRLDGKPARLKQSRSGAEERSVIVYNMDDWFGDGGRGARGEGRISCHIRLLLRGFFLLWLRRVDGVVVRSSPSVSQ